MYVGEHWNERLESLAGDQTVRGQGRQDHGPSEEDSSHRGDGAAHTGFSCKTAQ